MLQGTRYPTLGFMSGGAGESDYGILPDPYETFSYDVALHQAGIADFNVISCTSVLPKEIYGNIYRLDEVQHNFHHGAVLEVIMAGQGADVKYHKAIITGVGIVWANDSAGNFIGGYAAEHIYLSDSAVDSDFAKKEAELWLTVSLNHELKIRGLVAKEEMSFYYNYLNLTKRYGYCMTLIGFLNYEYAPPVVVK